MERRIGWLAGVAYACWAVCLPAQKGAGGAKGTVPGVVRAEQVYRQLLAPGSRPDAMHLLWQLQGDALPVLARAVRSQDVDVVVAACAVLHDMGRVAAPVREVLARERQGAKGQKREALDRALHAVAARGFTFAVWKGEILFVDDEGKIEHKIDGVANAWDVQTLPGLRLLVAQVTPAGVRELDRQGAEQWSAGVDFGQPLRARRLWNGHTMIVDSRNGVTYLDRAGKVVRRHATGANCAVHLLNGHTLFVTGGSVLIELDRKGRTVREVKVPSQTYGMRHLPNGNTLLSTRSGKGVVIVDPKGAIVRTYDKIQNPSDAMLLEDGSMIVCGAQKAAWIDPDGSERWSIERQWVAGVCRGGL